MPIITRYQRDILDLASGLITQRRSRRFQLLFVAQSALRFLCLYKYLALTGSQFINPIFVTVCELGTIFIDLINAIFKQNRPYQDVSEGGTCLEKRIERTEKKNRQAYRYSTHYDWLKLEAEEEEECLSLKEKKSFYKL